LRRFSGVAAKPFFETPQETFVFGSFIASCCLLHVPVICDGLVAGHDHQDKFTFAQNQVQILRSTSQRNLLTTRLNNLVETLLTKVRGLKRMSLHNKLAQQIVHRN
jgi:hypothetical protein